MIPIKEDICWTGYADFELAMFHGYETPYGTTYNSYLILDEQPTLIDTVKDYAAGEMLSLIKEVIDPAALRYVVSNHSEMDHSGALSRLLELAPSAEVICSPAAVPVLKRQFKQDWRFRAVKTGDTLNIGKRTLSFIQMPMVHWPESMATYSAQDRVLFPNDAFGQHYASELRFSDEVEKDFIVKEAAKYYANIVLPYGGQVVKALAALSGLAIDMIAPAHGMSWRTKEEIAEITGLYRKWAEYRPGENVLIIYDTMWHSTEKMAERIAECLKKDGMPAKLICLADMHISDIMTEVLDAQGLIVGTPILNNRMLPTVASFLMYLKGLRPQRRWALTFGSYGWSKAGFAEVENFLKEAGFGLLAEGRYLQFVPDENELAELAAWLAVIKEQENNPDKKGEAA